MLGGQKEWAPLLAAAKIATTSERIEDEVERTRRSLPVGEDAPDTEGGVGSAR